MRRSDLSEFSPLLTIVVPQEAVSIDNSAPHRYYPTVMETQPPPIHDTPLSRLIARRIGESGPIPFARFMEMALYEPGLGYYTSPGRKVGADGDFYTSSNVHALFGRMIGRELAAMWRAMGEPGEFTACEVGAGGGRLACDILDGIRGEEPRLYDLLTYRFVEREPTLREVQLATCSPHAGHLAWSTPEEFASGRLQIRGCILSNELIDSFPVHRVEMGDDGLKELYVAVEGDRFVDRWDDPSDPRIPLHFARLGIWPPAGSRAEVNLAAVEWIGAAARNLARGFVLTVDYGFEARELYGVGRANGTLLCYHRHQTVDDPYARVGEQDITSHVDFTTLKRAGEEAGLENVWYGEQYRFLLGCGMMEELLRLESTPMSETERLRTTLALKKLILPEGGMGDTFKVLIQSKGVASPSLLCRRDWTRGL